MSDEAKNVFDTGANLNEEQRGSLGKVIFTPLHRTTISNVNDATVKNEVNIEFSPIIVTSYVDSVATNTTTETVFGRTDPIRFFQGNERTVQMTFLTMQEDSELAVRQFNKLKELMASQYPVYRVNPYVLKSAPLFRVQFKPALNATLMDEIGFLGGMKFDYANASEIINTPQFANGVMAPRYFQVNFDLKIIHRDVNGFNTIGNRINNSSFPFDY